MAAGLNPTVAVGLAAALNTSRSSVEKHARYGLQGAWTRLVIGAVTAGLSTRSLAHCHRPHGAYLHGAARYGGSTIPAFLEQSGFRSLTH